MKNFVFLSSFVVKNYQKNSKFKGSLNLRPSLQMGFLFTADGFSYNRRLFFNRRFDRLLQIFYRRLSYLTADLADLYRFIQIFH